MSNLEFSLHAMRALDRNPRDAREGPRPADAPEDTRERWTDLDQDTKLDMIHDYMGLRIDRGQPTLKIWMEALASDSAIDYIGRLIVRENDSELVW